MNPRRRWAAILLTPIPCLPLASAPTAHSDVCTYPLIGEGANILVGRGWFCDGPTEINGAHFHCEGGGFGINGVLGVLGSESGATGSFGLGGSGIGGASCTWRCPDNTLAPAPNPPFAWRRYLIPKPVACQDHMDPAGFWSEPVSPREGEPQGSDEEIPPGLVPGGNA